MIVGVILGLLGGVFAWMPTLFPDMADPADSIGQASGAWGQLLGYMTGAAGWFPFSVAGVCMLVVVSVALAAGAIRLVRIVASFLTGGGGSAA